LTTDPKLLLLAGKRLKVGVESFEGETLEAGLAAPKARVELCEPPKFDWVWLVSLDDLKRVEAVVEEKEEGAPTLG
jgi:hypothetical protein